MTRVQVDLYLSPVQFVFEITEEYTCRICCSVSVQTTLLSPINLTTYYTYLCCFYVYYRVKGRHVEVLVVVYLLFSSHHHGKVHNMAPVGAKKKCYTTVFLYTLFIKLTGREILFLKAPLPVVVGFHLVLKPTLPQDLLILIKY